jgi:hypothetical protein
MKLDGHSFLGLAEVIRIELEIEGERALRQIGEKIKKRTKRGRN